MPFNSVFQGVPPFPWGAWAGVGTGADTVAAMTRSFFVGWGGRGNGRGHGDGNDALGKGKTIVFHMLFWFYSFFGGYAGGRRNGRGHGSGNDALGRRKLQPFIDFWGLTFFSRDARAGAGTGADAVAAIARSGGGNYVFH